MFQIVALDVLLQVSGTPLQISAPQVTVTDDIPTGVNTCCVHNGRAGGFLIPIEVKRMSIQNPIQGVHVKRSSTVRMLGAIACAMLLTAGAAACGSSTGGDSSGDGGTTTGVTDTTIKIGIGVSDLDGLRAAGMALAPALTTQNLSKRLTSYFDAWNAAGGINGRKVEGVVLTWDPVKPATGQKVCDDATINNELFAFINANGLGAKYIECIVAA